MPTFFDVLVFVGMIAFAKVLIHWSRALYAHFLAAPLRLGYPWKKFGGWAVVTGATDGIGKAFAFELASKGYNIVLIGRDRQKLASVSAKILKKNRGEVNVIQADFTEEDCYERIERLLQEIRVGVLVNNVGMNLAYPEYLHLIPNGEKTLLDVLRCNLLPVTMLSRMILPKMKHVRSGLIINIASASALLPTPLVAVYSASKAYVDFLSRSLNEEYSEYGVTIQSVLPFTVGTKMTGHPEKSLFVPTPASFVRATLNTVGILKRTHGYFPHAFQGWYYSSLPEWFSQRMQRNFFIGLRESILKQQKDKAEEE